MAFGPYPLFKFYKMVLLVIPNREHARIYTNYNNENNLFIYYIFYAFYTNITNQNSCLFEHPIYIYFPKFSSNLTFFDDIKAVNLYNDGYLL